MYLLSCLTTKFDLSFLRIHANMNIQNRPLERTQVSPDIYEVCNQKHAHKSTHLSSSNSRTFCVVAKALYVERKMLVYVRSLSPNAVRSVSTKRSRVPARILLILHVSNWLTVWPGGKRSPSAWESKGEGVENTLRSILKHALK